MTTSIISRTRVFTKDCNYENPRTVPLSIIDSTVAYYGPTTAIWFFSAPSHESESNPQTQTPFTSSPETKQLITSLSHTLSKFPQWCGLLHYTNEKQNGNHTERYRRLAITYGKESDPGVEVVVAEFDRTLDSLVPDAASRRKGDGVWNGTHIPVSSLVPNRSKLSLGGRGNLDFTDKTLCCILIQITQFQCNGISIAVRSSHAIADSISLVYFVNCWAETNRALRNGNEIPMHLPVFNPDLLDQAATGDIDSNVADEEIMKRALGMPVHRYDTWTQPSPETGASHSIPQDFNPSQIKLGTPLPLDEVDPNAEISFYVFHFSHDEIERIWKDANRGEGRVSHHDALCAHFWILINRARGLLDDEGEKVHLDFTIGLRTRTAPPLSPTFLGSPCLIADINLPSPLATSATSLPLVASEIRRTIIQFNNTENIGAILHDKAFEESPQRYYHSFTGKRHVIQTSWIGNGMYDVEFGGRELRFAMAAMAMIDGFMQTMESAPFDGDEVSEGRSGDAGFDVSVRIEAKAMERLLADPMLRKYA